MSCEFRYLTYRHSASPKRPATSNLQSELVGVETDGKEVAKLKDGNFIGEVSFITGGAATATVKALLPTRYVAWPKEAISQLLNRNPSMRFAMQANAQHGFEQEVDAPRAFISGQDRSGFYLQT